MTPAQVDELDDETYAGFVRYMAREARELERAAAEAKRKGR
jgi:hypothetical protein